MFLTYNSYLLFVLRCCDRGWRDPGLLPQILTEGLPATRGVDGGHEANSQREAAREGGVRRPRKTPQVVNASETCASFF